MRIISGIGDWLCWNWSQILFWIVILIIIACIGTCIYESTTAPPRREQIRILAEGKLISIRATGSFSVYDTELKFEDGSMLLMTYSFCRSNRLRVGKNYKIWVSSFYGYRCKGIIND